MMLIDRRPVPTIAEIQEATCRHFRLRKMDMTSEARLREIAHPRQIAMFLCARLTPRSTCEIGRRFGGRDHSTVFHARRAVGQRIRHDREVAGHVIAVRRIANAIAAARPMFSILEELPDEHATRNADGPRAPVGPENESSGGGGCLDPFDDDTAPDFYLRRADGSNGLYRF